MSRYRYVLFAIAALAVHVSLSAGGGVHYNSFKTDMTDIEVDQWLCKTSATYATVAKEIKARKDIRGYRFASKDKIPRGMVDLVDGYLEIQLNPKLSGPDRMTTLIFEMANAARSGDHLEIDIAVDKGVIGTPEEFGIAHELLEFEALRLHREVLIEIESRSGALPKEFYYFVTPAPRSIKDYQLPALHLYLKTLKESGHTAHYHKYFHIRKSQPPPKKQ